MGFVAAKCTECGASIKVDDSKDAGICEYCGTPFVTEKVINNYNTYITNDYSGATIVGGDVDNLIEMANNAVEAKNYDDANSYFSKALEIDPKNREALFGKGYSACLGSSIIELNSEEVISYTKKAMNECYDEKFILSVVKQLSHLAHVIHFSARDYYNENWEAEDTTSVIIGMRSVSIKIVNYALSLLKEKNLHVAGQGLKYRKGLLDSGIKYCIENCAQRYCIDYETNEKVPIKATTMVHRSNLRQYEVYCEERKALDGDWTKPSINTNFDNENENEGCYIATYVYGSYEHPDVMKLRNYRDEVLKSSCLGRLFIQWYYWISPKLIKWMGERKPFRRVSKVFVELIVRTLR